MSEQFVQQTDPEDAFEALADETRLEILRALWDHEEQSATFSALRDAVGMRDSGQFNYHLDKLVGQFVIKTDDGYQLTQAGKHVNGAILSGVYTEQGASESIPLDSSCRACGDDQTLQYDREVARVTCVSCPVGWSAPVPPAVLAGYDREELPQVVSQYFQMRFQRIVNGFCSYCDGQMTQTVGPIDAMDIGPDTSDEDVDQLFDTPVVQFDCQRCGARAGLGLEYALLLAHPTVDHFYYEHGIDIREHLIWDTDLAPVETDLDGSDTPEACVTFRAGDATLTVTVDESFSVVSIDA